MGRPITLLLGGLLLLGAIVGGTWWWRSREVAPDGQGALIQAPPEPYKIKVTEPGGMQVEGKGDAAFATSEGEEAEGRLDLGAVPEEPMTAARGGEGAGATIELGVFATQKAAGEAWAGLTKRFGYLEGMTHGVAVSDEEGRSRATLQVTTASPRQARAVCARLRIAGESCRILP